MNGYELLAPSPYRHLIGIDKDHIPKVASVLPSAVTFAGLGVTIYLLTKARWGWALANFFLLTPIVAAGTAIAVILLTKKPKERK